MPLTFPTQAEKVLAAFRAPGKTKSLAKLAESAGADKEFRWPGTTIYTFDDDTTLTVTGRGKAHRVETGLP